MSISPAAGAATSSAEAGPASIRPANSVDASAAAMRQRRVGDLVDGDMELILGEAVLGSLCDSGANLGQRARFQRLEVGAVDRGRQVRCDVAFGSEAVD